MKTGQQAGVRLRTMCILAVVAGAAGIILQFFAGFEILAYMLSLAGVGGVIGGNAGYDEIERQAMERSYKPAFEGLLLIIIAGYVFTALANPISALAEPAAFINSHWPGLILAAMCLLLGICGLCKVQT